MKHVLIADEGCWLTRVGFTPEQESAPEFWKEVRTSEPEDYTEVTDARRIEMEEKHGKRRMKSLSRNHRRNRNRNRSKPALRMRKERKVPNLKNSTL